MFNDEADLMSSFAANFPDIFVLKFPKNNKSQTYALKLKCPIKHNTMKIRLKSKLISNSQYKVALLISYFVDGYLHSYIDSFQFIINNVII